MSLSIHVTTSRVEWFATSSLENSNSACVDHMFLCAASLAMHLLNDDLPPGKPLLTWHLQLVWIRRYYIHHHNYITGACTLQIIHSGKQIRSTFTYLAWKMIVVQICHLNCRVWCSAREVSIPEHGFDRNAATQVHSLEQSKSFVSTSIM